MPPEQRQLPSTLPDIPGDNRILYYDRDREAFRFLSHFWPSPFALDGEDWPTVEHYYQFHKSLDPEYRAAIRAADTPGRAKRLATSPDRPRRHSKQSWFRKTGTLPRTDWDDVKLDVMRRADRAKYDQNHDLAALLLATGDAELVEDSHSEPFWGIGEDGDGPNWAGRVLMEVRASLARS
ncbi:MAG: NADAR family protein [Pseudomonadota bacterium]